VRVSTRKYNRLLLSDGGSIGGLGTKVRVPSYPDVCEVRMILKEHYMVKIANAFGRHLFFSHDLIVQS
jgi:hypothetical protein